MSRTSRIALLLAGLAACTTLGERAERIRQDLIGLPARSLSACIGIPAQVDQDGEVEYLTFRWEWEPGEEEVFPRRRSEWEPGRIPRPDEPGSGPIVLRPGPASRDRDPYDPRETSRARDPYDPRETTRVRTPASRLREPERGYCELIFELRNRRVSDVQADGRTPEGLNHRASCLVEAQRCLPQKRR